MYIEFVPGQKYAAKGADKSDTPDSFQDCGYIIGDNEVIIDIDHLDKTKIRAMISEFKINTETVWTERGAHLYFFKPASFSKARSGVCKLGFEIEQHTNRTRPNGITVKRNGKLREINNPGKRQYLPDIFEIATKKRNYQKLEGLEQGDGRNKGLFAHRKALGECEGWQQILNFINREVFADPLPDDELSGIMREGATETQDESKSITACKLLKVQINPVNYRGSLWWYKDDRYVKDNEYTELRRRVCSMFDDEPTRFVDEVIKSLTYRAKTYDEDYVFPIRFNNGILHQGEFIPFKDYRDFTPYYIPIDYKPDAEPVQFVDDYIDQLTGNDEGYRNLLMEVLGYAFITDPERIRSLGKFFVFRGDGGNGKGTLLQVMKCILGKHNCTAMSIRELTDERYLTTMAGCLANLGDDLEPCAIDDKQLKMLKNISTCDTVSARQLYKQARNETFTCKLYFTSNHDIKSWDKGYAYKRRVLWLPMFTTVSKPDPKFISKATSKEALEYWISLIIPGYQRLYETGVWSSATVVDEYNEQYHENNNSMMLFARSLDLSDEILGKTMNQISKTYSEWNTDDTPFSKKLFRQAVWDEYKAGIGVSCINGKKARIFMHQSTTKQNLAP